MSGKQSKKLSKIAKIVAKDKKVSFRQALNFVKKFNEIHPMNLDKAIKNVQSK